MQLPSIHLSAYNQPMHIGIDCRLPFYEMGGISQYTIQLISQLSRLDTANRYTIYHSRKDPKMYIPDSPANFRKMKLWTPAHHRLERWTLGAELYLHGLDILHSPDFIPPIFGAVRHIVTIHDLNFIYYPEYLSPESRRYYLSQIEWATQTADHILADSEYTRQDLINKLMVPPSKVTTVYLAANPQYSLPIDQAFFERVMFKYQLSPGYILFVGTLSPRKNVDTLVQVLDRVRSKGGFNVKLILVGGRGWNYKKIFELSSVLNLEGHVRHLEGVPDEQLAAIYKGACILALPSHYEGFGLPVLEAMQSGCPVIASDRASLPEVVGNAGILLEPDDIDGWVEAITTVLESNSRREELINRGYNQAKKFSWRKTAIQTLQIYQQVAAS